MIRPAGSAAAGASKSSTKLVDLILDGKLKSRDAKKATNVCDNQKSVLPCVLLSEARIAVRADAEAPAAHAVGPGNDAMTGESG